MRENRKLFILLILLFYFFARLLFLLAEKGTNFIKLIENKQNKADNKRIKKTLPKEEFKF